MLLAVLHKLMAQIDLRPTSCSGAAVKGELVALILRIILHNTRVVAHGYELNAPHPMCTEAIVIICC